MSGPRHIALLIYSSSLVKYSKCIKERESHISPLTLSQHTLGEWVHSQFSTLQVVCKMYTQSVALWRKHSLTECPRGGQTPFARQVSFPSGVWHKCDTHVNLLPLVLLLRWLHHHLRRHPAYFTSARLAEIESPPFYPGDIHSEASLLVNVVDSVFLSTLCETSLEHSENS